MLLAHYGSDSDSDDDGHVVKPAMPTVSSQVSSRASPLSVGVSEAVTDIPSIEEEKKKTLFGQLSRPADANKAKKKKKKKTKGANASRKQFLLAQMAALEQEIATGPEADAILKKTHSAVSGASLESGAAEGSGEKMTSASTPSSSSSTSSLPPHSSSLGLQMGPEGQPRATVSGEHMQGPQVTPSSGMDVEKEEEATSTAFKALPEYFVPQEAVESEPDLPPGLTMGESGDGKVVRDRYSPYDSVYPPIGLKRRRVPASVTMMQAQESLKRQQVEAVASSPSSYGPASARANALAQGAHIDRSFADFFDGNATVVDVNQSDLTQKSLLESLEQKFNEKNEQKEVKIGALVYDSSTGSVGKTYEVSRLHKEKNQISNLAARAAANQLELARQRSSGFKTKRETMAKYGW